MLRSYCAQCGKVAELDDYLKRCPECVAAWWRAREAEMAPSRVKVMHNP
jgi:hypothetical protein